MMKSNKSKLLILFLLCPLILLSQTDPKTLDQIITVNNNVATSSGLAPNRKTTNTRQDLIAFHQINKKQYFTTGVDDNLAIATLNQPICASAKDENCINQKRFRAFPSNDLGQLLLGGSYTNLIGVPPSYTANNNPVINNYRIYLDDGTRGLDLSTGVFNISLVDKVLTFNRIKINPETIGDGIPDIIVTQIGQVNDITDIYSFKKIDGQLVGNNVIVNFGTVGEVIEETFNFYNATNTPTVSPTRVSPSIDGTRLVRLLALEWSDFGIDALNYNNVESFNQQFSGASDVAFIAYNEDSLWFPREISGTIKKAELDGIHINTIPSKVKLELYRVNNTSPKTETLIAKTDTSVNSPIGYYKFGDRTIPETSTYNYPKANENYKIRLLLDPSDLLDPLNKVPYHVVENADDNLKDTLNVELKLVDIVNRDFTIGNFCMREPSNLNGGHPSKIGISTLNKQAQDWPTNVPNGFIVLNSKEKGMVITRIEKSADIQTPQEGMIIYDKTDKCIKLYNGTEWACIERDCNEN